uniref:Gustatory receptor n=1 Tax=Tetranychus urticae TaxID=32264 RepID=T1KCC7_TETUR
MATLIDMKEIGKPHENLYEYFNNYLAKQLIHLNYLPVNVSKSSFLVLTCSLSLFIYFGAILKEFWLLFSDPSDDPIFYKLGAPTVSLGFIFHREISLILLLWLSGTLYCALFIKYTQYSKKHQSWIQSFVYLSPKASVSSLDKLIRKSFLLQTRIVLVFSVAGIALFQMITLSRCPTSLIAYCLFNYILNIFNAFLTAVYLGSTGCMFTFHCMMLGVTFNRLAKRVDKMINYLAINKQTAKHINVYLHRVTKELRHLNGSKVFWEHLNSTIFLSTYLAQSVLLYLLFFVSVPFLMKCSFFLMAIVNFLGGQSIHFIAGHIAKVQIEKCLFQLNRLMFRRIPGPSKIKIIQVLEHTRGGKFNTIFSAVEYSLASLIMVTSENAVLFMLLIVNYSRRSFNVTQLVEEIG